MKNITVRNRKNLDIHQGRNQGQGRMGDIPENKITKDTHTRSRLENLDQNRNQPQNFLRDQGQGRSLGQNQGQKIDQPINHYQVKKG